MRRAEEGSVLMLLPAGVLIVVLLGSIAVDFALAFHAERDLLAVADAAANDAATLAVDEDRYRREGVYALDPTRVDDVLRRSLAAHDLARRHPGAAASARIDPSDPRVVVVTITAEVDLLFADVIGADSISVGASSSARAEPG